MSDPSRSSLSEELWAALAGALSNSDRVVDGEQVVAALFSVAVEVAKAFDVDAAQHALAQVVELGAGTPADECEAVRALRDLFDTRRRVDVVDAALVVSASAGLN